MGALKRGHLVGGRWTVLKIVKQAPSQVCQVEGLDGQSGFLKFQEDRWRQRKPTYGRQRFLREVQIMRTLTGAPGVLPVLDVDQAADPHWFVTQTAELLADHFGSAPNLREVVESFAHLADTLARLSQDRDITHRDLKPDNLFWLNGEALLGDFGIAGMPDTEQMGLTTPGHKHGPWGYIAPEALNNDRQTDWRRADVYSLAKCLWKVSMGQPYPPQGTLYIRESGTTLYPVGGSAGLELARLLEIATHNRSHMRPSMARFRDELQTWLDRHPQGAIERPKPRRFSELFGEQRLQLQADQGGLDGIAAHCIHRILHELRSLRPSGSAVSADETATLEFPDDVIDAITGGNTEWEREFDATKVLTWDQAPNIRVVAVAIGEHDDATYVAQWQARSGPDGDWTAASPVRSARGTLWYPSDLTARLQLAEELAADDPALG